MLDYCISQWIFLSVFISKNNLCPVFNEPATVDGGKICHNNRNPPEELLLIMINFAMLFLMQSPGSTFLSLLPLLLIHHLLPC